MPSKSDLLFFEDDNEIFISSLLHNFKRIPWFSYVRFPKPNHNFLYLMMKNKRFINKIYELHNCICVSIVHSLFTFASNPVCWACRIQWLHLSSRVILPIECPVYDTKHSDGEALTLEFYGMPLLPDPLRPIWVQSIGQIELFCDLIVCK